MIANSYYEKALANLKTAKVLLNRCPEDEEIINMAGYHLQQALELVIKHIFSINGKPNQKTNDIDQLIKYAASSDVDLFLTPSLKERADIISDWEVKTRYIMGFALEYSRVLKAQQDIEEYFKILSKKIKY